MVAVSPSLSVAATDPADGDKIIYSGEEEVLIAVLERYVVGVGFYEDRAGYSFFFEHYLIIGASSSIASQ